MKRILLLILVMVLLVGCSAKPNPTDSPQNTTGPSQPGVPDSTIGQMTDGALQAYPVPAGTYADFCMMGKNLLICGETALAVFSTDKAEITASKELKWNLSAGGIDATAANAAYYLPDERKVVVLNPQLRDIKEILLPENMVGMPVISLERNEVFYATAKEIRALHISTGISRLIRQHSAVTQTLLETYFDGTVLLYRSADGNQGSALEYISTETGRTVSGDQGILEMQTYGESFFARRQDGTVHQLIFGTRNKEAKLFLPTQRPDGIPCGQAAVLEINGIVDYAETDRGLELAFYDLETGKCTARTVLPDENSPLAVRSDGTYVWLLTGGESGQMLYRWDIAKSKVTEDSVCVGKLYTADNPDTEGLERCRQLADACQEKHKIELLLWTDAVNSSNGYAAASEYHPQVFKDMLTKLDGFLEKFPEGFWQETADGGRIRVMLVRSLQDGFEWKQFWQNGQCCIVISSGTDPVKAFLQGAAYAIDSHVLGNSRDFDTWDTLNPEGFQYTYSDNPEEKPEYLTGETRAFTDRLAMTYPHEDRCRMFCYAMLEGNKDVFTSVTMQAKLLRLCKGIREAYGLEKSEENYPWEQYLTISLAYRK